MRHGFPRMDLGSRRHVISATGSPHPIHVLVSCGEGLAWSTSAPLHLLIKTSSSKYEKIVSPEEPQRRGACRGMDDRGPGGEQHQEQVPGQTPTAQCAACFFQIPSPLVSFDRGLYCRLFAQVPDRAALVLKARLLLEESGWVDVVRELCRGWSF